MSFSELFTKAIPFIIPVVLVGSWLVNHEVSVGSGKKSEKKPEPPKDSKPEPPTEEVE